MQIGGPGPDPGHESDARAHRYRTGELREQLRSALQGDQLIDTAAGLGPVRSRRRQRPPSWRSRSWRIAIRRFGLNSPPSTPSSIVSRPLPRPSCVLSTVLVPMSPGRCSSPAGDNAERVRFGERLRPSLRGRAAPRPRPARRRTASPQPRRRSPGRTTPSGTPSWCASHAISPPGTTWPTHQGGLVKEGDHPLPQALRRSGGLPGPRYPAANSHAQLLGEAVGPSDS